MKQKVRENKSENEKMQSYNFKTCEGRFFFPAVLIVVFVLIFSVVFFNALFGESQNKNVAQETCNDSGVDNLKISTDKASYAAGDKITLHIENRGKAVVYFEPCKDINVFEKNENGAWMLKQGSKVVFNYEQSDFEKKSGNVECQIDLPAEGAGSYRVVMPIFYGCTKPSQYACEGSEIFRSNEFEVAASAPASDNPNMPAPGTGAAE